MLIMKFVSDGIQQNFAPPPPAPAGTRGEKLIVV